MHLVTRSERFHAIFNSSEAGLEHELKTINPMFSMKDIIKMMGPNTASYIQMSDQLGTLSQANLPTSFFWTAIRSKAIGTC